MSKLEVINYVSQLETIVSKSGSNWNYAFRISMRSCKQTKSISNPYCYSYSHLYSNFNTNFDTNPNIYTTQTNIYTYTNPNIYTTQTNIYTYTTINFDTITNSIFFAHFA